MRRLILGLGFGDEGKGTTVDYWSKVEPGASIIRFSGGPQAAHNVMLPTGEHHTFSQFGSGTFHNRNTYHSHHTLFDVFSYMAEALHLHNLGVHKAFQRVFVSENAILLTPLHSALNKWREQQRGSNNHGSTGYGIGEAVLYATRTEGATPLYMKDLLSKESFMSKMKNFISYYETQTHNTLPAEDLAHHYWEAFSLANADLHKQGSSFQDMIVPDSTIIEAIIADDNVIFEGTQGALLDEWHGFHPHTTWAHTNDHNAKELLQSASIQDYHTTGVTRTYLTRHGAGPLLSEYHNGEKDSVLPELHNTYGQWQGNWRRGAMDFPFLSYGASLSKIDSISLTHCDYPLQEAIVSRSKEFIHYIDVIRSCTKDEDKSKQEQYSELMSRSDTITEKRSFDDLSEFIDQVEHSTKAPVNLISYGTTWQNKAER